MKKLSNKTWFIYYKGFKIWLSDEEAKAVRNALLSGNTTLDVEGRIFKSDDIALLKGEDNDILEKTKKGMWQCEYGYWHNKNDQCAHHMLKNN